MIEVCFCLTRAHICIANSLMRATNGATGRIVDRMTDKRRGYMAASVVVSGPREPIPPPYGRDRGLGALQLVQPRSHPCSSLGPPTFRRSRFGEEQPA